MNCQSNTLLAPHPLFRDQASSCKPMFDCGVSDRERPFVHAILSFLSLSMKAGDVKPCQKRIHHEFVYILGYTFNAMFGRSNKGRVGCCCIDLEIHNIPVEKLLSVDNLITSSKGICHNPDAKESRPAVRRL